MQNMNKKWKKKVRVQRASLSLVVMDITTQWNKDSPLYNIQGHIARPVLVNCLAILLPLKVESTQCCLPAEALSLMTGGSGVYNGHWIDGLSLQVDTWLTAVASMGLNILNLWLQHSQNPPCSYHVFVDGQALNVTKRCFLRGFTQKNQS